VCSGLLSHVADHEALVMRFAQWQLQKAQHIATLIEHPFSIRVSVCTGPLLGGVAGEAAMRYVVAGPALDVARWALVRCDPNKIVMSNASDATGWGATSNEAASERASWQPRQQVAQTDTASERGNEPPPEGEFDFSPVSLRFDMLTSRQEFDVAQERDLSQRYIAAIPFGMSLMFLAVVLLERAVDNPTRHHNSPFALSFLGIAICFSIAHLTIRLRAITLPLAVDYAIIFVALASLSLCLFTISCLWLVAVGAPYFGMGVMSHFRRIVWGAQYAMSFITVVGPVAVFSFLTPLIRLKIVAVSLVVLSVVHRYLTVKTDCMRFIAMTLSRRTLGAATERLEMQASLLAGLIPPHAREHAVPTQVELGENGVPGGVVFCCSWNGLSVLQLRLHMASKVFDFSGVAGAYSVVTASVEAHGGSLELVQATGDTFLVVGPFTKGATDSERFAAAKNAVATLRALALALAAEGNATFVAVATSGSAFAALIGANALTFRIAGAAVRESNALLAAAPTPLGEKRSVAFASEAFRRQECNYVVPRGLTAAGNVGWSMALAAPSLSTAPPATVHAQVDEASFGPRAVWRVRGVGAMQVSSLVL
jgi:hypothetical protein